MAEPAETPSPDTPQPRPGLWGLRAASVLSVLLIGASALHAARRDNDWRFLWVTLFPLAPYLVILWRSRRAKGVVLALVMGSLALVLPVLAFSLQLAKGLQYGDWPETSVADSAPWLLFAAIQIALIACGIRAYRPSTESPSAGALEPGSGGQAAEAGSPAAPRTEQRGPSLAWGVLCLALCVTLMPGLPIVALFLAPPAIISGHIAARSLRQSGAGRRAKWRARFNYCAGYAAVVAFFVVLLSWPRGFAFFQAGEHPATGTLRTLNTAMVTFASTYDLGFPDTLDRLGPPQSGQQPSVNNAHLLPPMLAGRGKRGTKTSVVKSGYRFTYRPGPGRFGTIATYTITARPIQHGKSGLRSFFTNESAVIRATVEDREATVNDMPI